MRIAGPSRAALLAAAALLLCARPAATDEVRTKDGRVIEGTVLEDGPEGLRIRLRFGGELTVARAEVQSVERRDLPEEAIAKKRAALDPADAEGRWKLAQEAKAQKVRKAYEELVDEVLRIDPGHAGANELRGNVLYDGKWMKPAERDRLAAEKERADKAGQGLVEYKGRWVTPEERDALERGLVKKDGRWMSEAEAKALDGFVEYKGGWVKKEELESVQLRDVLADAAGVPLTVALSERFSVATYYKQADTDLILADAEKSYGEFATLYGVKPEDRLFDDPFNHRKSRCTIVVLQKEPQYQKFLDGLLRFHADLAKVLRPERVALMRKQKGFYLVDPDCWIVGYEFPFPKEQMRHTVVHKLSHVMLIRCPPFRGMGWLGWWLLEGLGEMQEVGAFGTCQVYCATTGYGEKPPDAKGIGEAWKAEAKRMVVTGGDRRLQEIVPKGLNDLEPWDLIKCWSFVHFLASLDKEKLRALTLLLKGGKVPAAEAIQRIYDASPDQMDDRWRDFVKKTY